MFQTLFHPSWVKTKTAKNDADFLLAREIAGSGNYEKILAELRGKNLLTKYEKAVKSKYEGAIALTEFLPSDEDWEMLTVLWLYDEPTAEHCIRTLGLTHEIAVRELEGPRGEKISLHALVEKNISLQKFLRASLFHDIGKLALPREVVKNTLNDHEMGEIFFKMCHEESSSNTYEKFATCEDSLKYLYEHGLRPKDVVPVRMIFTGDSSKILEVIERNGFSKEETLGEILSRHEQESEKIFAGKDHEVADIVGHHHPGVRLPKHEFQENKETDEYFKKHIVHFMLAVVDEHDAISGPRDYKKPVPKAEMLSILARETQSGRLEKGLTYLWVKKEYDSLKKDPNDKKFYDTIEEFLENQKNKDAVGELVKMMG